MNQRREKIIICIDNRFLEVEKGQTILQAAEQHDIYIPTLCAHKDLTPFGGCRMCIVEVEKMRGFPTACTTPVEPGMVIRTHTAQIEAVRREILQLILSEHTSSCLICDEKDNCREYMGTIRKAGVTTGCRFCPNDDQCELQEVTEKLGIDEIGYPVYYRQLQVEKNDPFYDRDYNLCILCGRCVRMCQEIRMANTLAFTQRGRHTVIGPAFGRTHFDAGCEFCGACVSVCPTGALFEKARKWDGKPEREVITTCSLCGVGCQMRLLVKRDRVIGTLPAEDPLVNNGQLCVKGRFCVTELVNHHQRVRRPYKTERRTKVLISWEEAVELAAEKLSASPSGESAMLVSPNCTNEDLYVAQKFARVALGTHNIDTSARLFYGSGFNAYLNLMRMGVPLSGLRKASVVLCLGLDTRFGRSVVGVELRQAIRRGAKIITINPWHHSLSVIADKWLQPTPGTELDMLRSLIRLIERKRARSSSPGSKRRTGGRSGELAKVAEMLGNALEPLILVGSEFLWFDKSRKILEAIERLAQSIGAGILPLPAQNNLFGSLLMGAYPELLPGGFPATDNKRIGILRKRWGADVPAFSSQWNAEALSSGMKMKVLYLVGEVSPNGRPPADFLIQQNMYPPVSLDGADLVLPSAAFTEVDGTFINGEGRIQRVRKAVAPPGDALPDWEIICRIARKMGVSGFDFTSAEEIHKDIAGLVDGFEDFEDADRTARSLACDGELVVSQRRVPRAGKADKASPLLLSASFIEHTHRGFPLSTWVDGAGRLFPVGVLGISPEDAREIAVSAGDEVVVTSADLQKVWPIVILNEQPPGTLHVVLRQGESIGSNPSPVTIRKKDV